MKLTALTVQKFRNFVEPQRVEVEADVTVLVGKNESGKTTILKALHRLKPANGDSRSFDSVTEYPRWRLSRDRRDLGDLSTVDPVMAEFSLDAVDVGALEDALPGPLLPTTSVHAARSYSGATRAWLVTPVADVIEDAGKAAAVEEADLAELIGFASMPEAEKRSVELAAEHELSHPARARALNAFPAAVAQRRHLFQAIALTVEQRDALWARIPWFFYFSKYSVLPGESDITELAQALEGGEQLTEEDQTVVSLLQHAGVAPKDFLDTNYDSRKAELQAAAGDLSAEVFNYWRVNRDLSVVFGEDVVERLDRRTNSIINHRILKIELRDARHGDVETNFSSRSSGFQWFFSFFAAFSEYMHAARPIVVLLDEPGTSLHGEAQKDFVDYIFNELGASKQTLYTTHSQFMVDPTQYEKLRAVHDRATRDDRDQGVAVTQVSLSADRDTILPVESALEYSIAQHLFLGKGPHLAVEGSSDFVFLTRLSAYLEQQSRTFLDPRFAIIPVGGVSNMPAFVALMGRRLDVSALVDGASTSSILERARRAASENGVDPTTIVAVAEVDDSLPPTADIEDLFAPADYLKLFNWAFDSNVRLGTLPPTPIPIAKKLQDLQGKFDHARPAHALTRHHAEFFANIDPVTIDRFEAAFRKLNQALA